MAQQVQRALVFANGDFSIAHYHYLASQGNEYVDALVVCVDGGLKHCLDCQLKPNLLIGDMDSIASGHKNLTQYPDVEKIVHPPEKNQSDLHLCLQLLADRGVTDVVVFGHSGGRTDHMLFNWSLFGATQWPFKLRMIDATLDARVVCAELEFSGHLEPGAVFSVLPISGTASGVSVAGAKYPLTDVTLSAGDSLGLSNEASGGTLRISTKTGLLLFMLVRTL